MHETRRRRAFGAGSRLRLVRVATSLRVVWVEGLVVVEHAEHDAGEQACGLDQRAEVVLAPATCTAVGVLEDAWLEDQAHGGEAERLPQAFGSPLAYVSAARVGVARLEGGGIEAGVGDELS